MVDAVNTYTAPPYSAELSSNLIVLLRHVKVVNVEFNPRQSPPPIYERDFCQNESSDSKFGY